MNVDGLRPAFFLQKPGEMTELTQIVDPPDPTGTDDAHDDIIYPPTIPFLLVHLTCFAAIWTGVTVQALLVCVALYVFRMIAVTAGYHRYFSHRSFRTSRVGQFILAALCQTSAQRGVIWWAAKHRHHHRHSDTELDVHSPRHRGFFYSHVGWIFSPRHTATDYSVVTDLTQYPELVWLDKHQYVTAFLLAVATFLAGGWPMLIVGFFWSTVLLYHGSFMINSLAHVYGRQRYVTGDDSRNNWFLALFTMGEGWHNNHHAYQRSTRQGFRWWEIDVTFYVLKLLSWFRIVWDLGAPPLEVVRNEHKLGRATIEKVARQLAASFPADRIAAQLREAMPRMPQLSELRTRLIAARDQATAQLAELHLPHVPSLDDVRQRARDMFSATPSLDDIAERARQLLLQAVALRLFNEPEGAA
jgi:stearoyl-CoA desaturase (delta-9 desaturase)